MELSSNNKLIKSVTKKIMVDSAEYQFDSIKQRVEGIIDTVVNQKCKDIPAYDAKLGQTWSNEIAEEIVRKS